MALQLFIGGRRYYAFEMNGDELQLWVFTIPELRNRWVCERSNRRVATAREAYQWLRRHPQSMRCYYAEETDSDGCVNRVRRFPNRAQRDAWVAESPQTRRAIPAARAYPTYKYHWRYDNEHHDA